MTLSDFDAARKNYAALKDILLHHPGGWADEAALSTVKKLCGAAGAALDDSEGREHLKFVEGNAAALFSENDHQKFLTGSLKGTDYLRLRILGALSAFSRRVHEVEALWLTAQAKSGARFDPHARRRQ